MVGGGHGVPVVQRSTGNDLLRAMSPRVVSHFPLCFQVREGSPLPGVSTSKSIRTVSIKHKRPPWSITRKAQMISLAAKESAWFLPPRRILLLASPATTLRMYTSASHVVARRFSHGGRNCLTKVRRQKQHAQSLLQEQALRPASTGRACCTNSTCKSPLTTRRRLGIFKRTIGASCVKRVAWPHSLEEPHRRPFCFTLVSQVRIFIFGLGLAGPMARTSLPNSCADYPKNEVTRVRERSPNWALQRAGRLATRR